MQSPRQALTELLDATALPGDLICERDHDREQVLGAMRDLARQ
jgi:hypothetical protein